MKGQSAIEYLSTYGWMIIAVAVVTGVAYSNISNSCTSSSAEFYTGAVEIKDFGLDGNGNLLLAVENTRYQKIQFNYINVTVEDKYRYKTLDLNLSSSEQGQISVSGFQSTGGCNTVDLRLNFDKGRLESQEVTGIIRASIGLAD